MTNWEFNTSWSADAELTDKVEDSPAMKPEQGDTNFSMHYGLEILNPVAYIFEDYFRTPTEYIPTYKGKVIEKPVLYNEVGDSILGFTYVFQEGDADIVYLNFPAIQKHLPKGPHYHARDNVSLHEIDHNDHPYSIESQIGTETQTR